ncbi:hypothetical protein GOP47_0021279 [Adiantum capillus-veneris]|uniref:histidine kinase n=1 Tax=Adiantum capillus-veneris TaxID=13818 RepID=A0A9D4UAT2_ADICA|nr:hypothetical protein GOP47_0021279 [Adiantum capillus-veneris]
MRSSCTSCFGLHGRSHVPAGVSSSDVAFSEHSSIDIGHIEDHSDDFSAEAARNRKSLRASICLKLTVFVGFLVVLASGIPALVLWLKAHEQLVEEIDRRLLTVSTLRQEQLKDYLISETDKAGLIATRVLINNYLSNRAGSNKSLAEFDLKSAVSVISDFLHAAVYDSEGELVISTGKLESQNLLRPGDVAALQSKKLLFGYPTQTSRGWVYNISTAIYRKQRLIGVLLTWVNATKLERLVYDGTGLQGTGELLVGVPQDPKTVRLLFPPLQNPAVAELPFGGAMARAINGETGIRRERDYNGVKTIAAYRPVGFMRWGLLAKLEVREAYAPVRNVRLVIIITIVVLVSLGVLASLGLAKIFTSPIVELGRAAASLGQGNMHTRVRKGTILLRDEIADLKDIFNSMAQQIASHQLILEHKVRERTLDLARANDGLAKEVEERKRIEGELEKAKDIAIAANRSKSEFLANMSHEIRTPLNAIVNFTELCLGTDITPEQHEHLDYVRFAAQHLLRLITDILDFSKIEAGKLEMEEMQFSLFDQLDHAVTVLAARASKAGLELCCSIDANVPDLIVGDPGRLLQIFVNLIGNGIKFTKEGEVVISASVKNRTEDFIELLFAVKDTGLGIPESKQTLLFKAFSQVDSSTQRVYGGTGLGLVISAKLAAAMGGSMWVESEGAENQGSTFWFTARFRKPLASTPTVPSFKDAYALVVDDNLTSQGILVDLLKSWGMLADGASNVESAKSALEKASNCGRPYNVVLLDMWLNGTDAFELVHFLRMNPSLLLRYCTAASSAPGRREQSENDLLGTVSTQSEKMVLSQTKVPMLALQESPSVAQQIPDAPLAVIILTSLNLTDVTRCKELGTKFYTTKPVKRSLLVRVLQSALGTQDEASDLEGQASSGGENLVRSLHILVAEDNVVNQKVVVKLLQKWGHTFVLACNGAEAVEQYTKEAFDLILMDVQMPVCDGFEATSRIREIEKASTYGKHTPIVAMTAHAMSGDGDRCISAGMDYYISKPLNSKKLQDILQSVATGSIRECTYSSPFLL